MSPVIDYSARHRESFRALNLAWIEHYFTVEDSDRVMLDDPETEVIGRGGHIFVIEEEDSVLGVCALVPSFAGNFQLAKMAVTEKARGRGLGRLLADAAIERARRSGSSHVELYTNTMMEPAMGLYRALGFVEVPLVGAEHVRSNIMMVLRLR